MTNSSLNVSEFMFLIPRFDGFRSGLSLSSSWGVTEAFALPETEHPLHALKLKGDGYTPPKEFICLLYGIANDGSVIAWFQGVQRVQRVQKLGKINQVTRPWYIMAHMKPTVMAAKLGLA